jgi:hypothetical protein
MLMGAIPVILDWQAEALASWFSGVLFRTQVLLILLLTRFAVAQRAVTCQCAFQDRFEDIFIVLDWKAAHEYPEYILHRLCTEVVSGTAVWSGSTDVW